MLQKLQKYKPSYTNTSFTSKEETIHLKEPADRASRPIEWMFERTFKPIEQPTRSNCCPIEWPTRSKYIVYFFRVTHRCVIELFRLTYSQCSLQSTINHCEYTRSLFAFSTFGCYIRYLYQNTINHTTQLFER